MNGSTGFLAVALSMNLRYRPHSLACEVNQISAGRLRSIWNLRSKSERICAYSFGSIRLMTGSIGARGSPSLTLQAFTTRSTLSPPWMLYDNAVQPRELPEV